jgi:hypothetical protein
VAGVSVGVIGAPVVTNVMVPVDHFGGVLNVLQNDHSSNNTSIFDPLDLRSLSIIRNCAKGAVNTNPDGTFYYTPGNNFVGTDSFTYTIADLLGTVSAPATVTVDVGKDVSFGGNSGGTVVYKDSSGARVAVRLSSGTADAYFTGSNFAVRNLKQYTLLTGDNLQLHDLELNSTDYAADLNFTSAGGKGLVQLGNITAPAGT